MEAGGCCALFDEFLDIWHVPQHAPNYRKAGFSCSAQPMSWCWIFQTVLLGKHFNWANLIPGVTLLSSGVTPWINNSPQFLY